MIGIVLRLSRRSSSYQDKEEKGVFSKRKHGNLKGQEGWDLNEVGRLRVPSKGHEEKRDQ